MKTVEMVIVNPSGLHARPAGLFVRRAIGFKCTVTIQNLDTGQPPVNAKSLIAVLSGGLSKGSKVRITTEGEDEAAAIADLESALTSGLGESVG
jgi:phosphotransferase system HPr (HPr) family protein